MGYCIHQKDEKFFMREDNREPAFKALVASAEDTAIGHWVSCDDVKEASNFQEAMEAFRWEINPEGDVDSIEFIGEKLSESLGESLKVIAPFVKSGSYIEMVGEDGEHWKYIFEDGGFRESVGCIAYD